MSLRLFFLDFLRSPLRMGSVVPSGRALARAMVDCARISPGHSVVELGAGTGAFTQAIVERCPDSTLTAFEISPVLGEVLVRRFPSVKVVVAPVEDLPALAPGLGIHRFDRVVSGLPWAVWEPERQAAVLDAIVPFLSPGARFVTFHYVHSRALGRVKAMGRLLRERFGNVTQSPPVWANFPPAFVHIASDPRPSPRATPGPPGGVPTAEAPRPLQQSGEGSATSR